MLAATALLTSAAQHRTPLAVAVVRFSRTHLLAPGLEQQQGEEEIWVVPALPSYRLPLLVGEVMLVDLHLRSEDSEVLGVTLVLELSWSSTEGWSIHSKI